MSYGFFSRHEIPGYPAFFTKTIDRPCRQPFFASKKVPAFSFSYGKIPSPFFPTSFGLYCLRVHGGSADRSANQRRIPQCSFIRLKQAPANRSHPATPSPRPFTWPESFSSSWLLQYAGRSPRFSRNRQIPFLFPGPAPVPQALRSRSPFPRSPDISYGPETPLPLERGGPHFSNFLCFISDPLKPEDQACRNTADTRNTLAGHRETQSAQASLIPEIRYSSDTEEKPSLTSLPGPCSGFMRTTGNRKTIAKKG